SSSRTSSSSRRNAATAEVNRESRAHLCTKTRTITLTHLPRYWQEQIDAGNFRDSVLLNPETGFGGNGNDDDGCIQDGPFADYRNQIGLGYTNRDQCIRRRLNETASVF